LFREIQEIDEFSWKDFWNANFLAKGDEKLFMLLVLKQVKSNQKADKWWRLAELLRKRSVRPKFSDILSKNIYQKIESLWLSYPIIPSDRIINLWKRRN
jgi:hypothetical protein